MLWPVRMYRLVSEPSEPGLCCRRDGLTLAGIPLLTEGGGTFAPRPDAEIQTVLNVAYGFNSGLTAADFLPGLQSVAHALSDGDLSRAMIAALLLKLPELDQGAVVRLAQAEPFLKANFNELEPRDHGRWATSGGSSLTPVQFVPSLPAPLLPPFPGLPGTNAPGRNADDDFPYQSQSANGQSTGVSQTDVQANLRSDDKPQLCPDPGPDTPHGSSDEANLYQQQITGLPIGQAVKLNGVYFDGCRESDGTMLEAKGENLLWMTLMPRDWLVTKSKLYRDAMKQAESQSVAAGWRTVEWHFAEKPVADLFRKEFSERGFHNIKVYYDPPDFQTTKLSEEYNLLKLWDTGNLFMKSFP